MTQHRNILKRGLLASVLGAVMLGALPAEAAPRHNANSFASPRFEKVWRDADQAVAEGRTNRSWTWGPKPWFDYKEFYQQSPNGLRQVQYFDKARMEINNPNNTSGQLQGVTNGLLPVEMVSGRIKLGDGTGPDQNDQREPAPLPIAGDPIYENPDAPTYASFRSVATTDNGYKDQNKLGQRAGMTINRDGSIGFRQDLADKPGTEIVAYESVTGHNVPRVFNDFRNGGPVPAISAFGLPITDAYWVTTKVGGQNKDVLVQMFERRVITYTPSNPAQYQVEMGNVGQHYFLWRYEHLRNAWQEPIDPIMPIYFATRQYGPEFTVATFLPQNSEISRVTPGEYESVPFSVLRTYSGATFWVGDNKQPGPNRQLVGANYSSGRIAQLPIFSGDTKSNSYNAAVSPDGTKLAFASDRDGNVELYLLNRMTGRVATLTETNGCTNQYPSWLPDGSGLVYESDCLNGNFEIYRAALSYTADSMQTLAVNHISPQQATRLTNNNSQDRYPRVSVDGTRIAFTANRDGNLEVYVMGVDGSRQTRVTNSAAVDQAPSWSQNSDELVFASDRDGDFELFKLQLSDNQTQQLTANNVEDNWPVWGQ